MERSTAPNIHARFRRVVPLIVSSQPFVDVIRRSADWPLRLTRGDGGYADPSTFLDGRDSWKLQAPVRVLLVGLVAKPTLHRHRILVGLRVGLPQILAHSDSPGSR
jgi:hypothetical protein